MYLIEILLPVRDNEGRPFAAKTYQALRDELTELYGGATGFTRGAGPKRDEALEDPLQNHRRVSEIARGWSFSDMTHFGRTPEPVRRIGCRRHDQ